MAKCVMQIFLIVSTMAIYGQKQLDISFDKLLTSRKECRKLLENGSDSLKIQAIKYLLNKKGDTRINQMVWLY